MNTAENTCYVLGAGAIGCLWAVRLHKKGTRVKLLLSENRKRRLGDPSTYKIRYASAPGAKPVNFEFDVASEADQISSLLLATKANDALTAMQSVSQQLSSNATVATLCNGMGYHDTLAGSLQPRALYAITTTDGAYFDRTAAAAVGSSSETKPPLLVLAGRGQSKIARIKTEHTASENWRDKLQETAALFSTHGHALQARYNTQRLLLDKLLINACINGLTAIHSCANGGLLQDDRAKQQLQDLLDECIGIATAAGHATLANNLSKRVHGVIEATASNYSSSYTDIQNGRRTEVPYINAYLVTLADSLGLTATRNQEIVDAVKGLEN